MDWENVDEEDPHLRVSDEVLSAYPPDRDALFALVRSQTTDRMLEIIANCDYGNEFREHLVGLKRIRAGVDLDVPIGWNPNEVLALFRWSEFEGSRDFKKVEEFHIARAFCCCALLRVPEHNDNRSLFDVNSLVQLFESCLSLGEAHRRGLIQYLAWSFSEMSLWDGTLVYYAFGLICVIAFGRMSDSSLFPVLSKWFCEVHRELIPQYKEIGYAKPLTFLEDEYPPSSIEKWRRMATELKEKAKSAEDQDCLMALL